MASNSYKRFTQFFKRMDRERLDGLDESYFLGMSEDEKQKAYEYLKNALDEGSDEAVTGLGVLCGKKCVPLLENRIQQLRKELSLTEQRLILALRLWEFTGDIQYQNDLIQFLNNKNDTLKQTAILFLSKTPTTAELINKLEIIISEDNDGTVWYVAARQLLSRYGIKDEDVKTGAIYKKNILNFISTDYGVRQNAIKWLKTYVKDKNNTGGGST